MAYTITANTAVAYGAMVWIVMAHTDMDCTVVADKAMDYTVMAYIGMA